MASEFKENRQAYRVLTVRVNLKSLEISGTTCGAQMLVNNIGKTVNHDLHPCVAVTVAVLRPTVRGNHPEGNETRLFSVLKLKILLILSRPML